MIATATSELFFWQKFFDPVFDEFLFADSENDAGMNIMQKTFGGFRFNCLAIDVSY